MPSAASEADAAADLPESVAASLLLRWREPHRDYHGESHLRAGLATLRLLGAGRIERIAFWFHDAVHTNTTPADEYASVHVARQLLSDYLTAAELEEVRRLIEVTIDHAPASGDLRAARVSDADLAGFALEWPAYRRNVDAIRRELPGLADAHWKAGRAAVLRRFLDRPQLFHTALGRERWELRGRENLLRELREFAS